MRKYYRSDGQIRKGPFSLKELKEQSFSEGDYIWCEGLEDWQPADKLVELAGLAPKAEGEAVPVLGKTSSVSIAVSSKSDRLRLWAIITIFYVFVVTRYDFIKALWNLVAYEFGHSKWINPAFYVYNLALLTDIVALFLLAYSIYNPKWRKFAYAIALIEALYQFYGIFFSGRGDWGAPWYF